MPPRQPQPPLDPVCKRISSIVYESLVQVCGGQDHDPSSAAIRLELEQLALATVARTTTTQTTAATTTDADDTLEGKPWNVEVRVAPSIFHRWKNRTKKRCRAAGSDDNGNHNHNDSVLEVTSDMGLARCIRSPRELGELLLTNGVEDGCRSAQVANDVRCNLSGFLCIVTPDRAQALRRAGRLACPHCVQWCKGEKGLWWHCQQQHSSEYSVAMSAAMSQRNTLALIPYQNSAATTQLDTTTTNTSTDVDSPNGSVVVAPSVDCPFQAVKNGDLPSLQRHVHQHGYDPAASLDAKGASPLLWAAGGGHVDILHYLIADCACDPNVRQRGKRSFAGRTPLHWAARNGHLAAVQYLVNTCRVDLEAATADGTTAFCWAAWQAHMPVLQFLQRAGVCVSKRNIYGCNAALWCAQGEGDATTMEWLLSVGCPMAVVNTNFHGVLHKASQRGRRDMCEWFCRKVVQLDLVAHLQSDQVEATHATRKDEKINLQLVGPDSDGCTPSDLAGMEGHEELAAWIASQEMKLVQAAMTQEASFEPPTWLVQVPEGVAMLTRSSELVFEPWAGVRRMRSILHSTVQKDAVK